MPPPAMVPNQTEIALPELKLLIDNRWVPSQSGRTFATTNPSTGEEICQVAEADAADVDAAVRAARAAFESGRGVRCTPQSEAGFCTGSPT